MHDSMFKSLEIYNNTIDQLSNSDKLLITTMNAHCYNLAKKDCFYQEALRHSNVLIPDGISVVWASKWLTGQRIKKIAGADLFFYEMERLNQTGGRCFFLGSTNETLMKIKERINNEYPNVEVDSYSPPYKTEFNSQENEAILFTINEFRPDVLMIGMTAPKQEKWAYQHYNQLQVGHICCIGAVFDFYAETIKRAPQWMIRIGLEWFYRLIKEPRRMWRRYIVGNTLFIFSIMIERLEK